MKVIASIVCITFLYGCYAKKPEQTGLEGKPLPAFNLLLTDSLTRFNTGNIPTGKPVVLFYFGPHCPYSKAQMEEIIEDMDRLKNIQFYLFTTSSFQEMKDFYEHYRLQQYQNVKVGLDYNHFFMDYYEVIGVPYMAIFGKDKRLNQAFVGEVYGKQIKKVAEK